MKLSSQILFLAALIALAMFTTPAFAQQQSNGAEVGPAIALNAPTRGVVFKTAAINSDGTRAQSFRAVASIHLGTGTYQVTFDENVQALNGFSRWVQGRHTDHRRYFWCQLHQSRPRRQCEGSFHSVFE
jgi:hypothetical protein